MSSKYPILVVDDDPVSCTLIKKFLTKAGFEVATAANGSDALNLCEQRFFPIVLTDWMMPHIDGIQLCQSIRKKETDNYVYLVLITSRRSKDDIISGLESGADDYLIKPVNQAELLARINSGIRVLELEESLKGAHQEIRQLSITDALTGCYNRVYLNEHFEQELGRSMRYHQPLSVIMADIDHFKSVNDTYGHQVGDGVLKMFAQILRCATRESIDWIVRYGGEEFLIVLPETGCEGTIVMAERLRRLISQTIFTVGDLRLEVTASFGGACACFNMKQDRDIAMADLIEHADTELYQCKNSGRNRSSVSQMAPLQWEYLNPIDQMSRVSQ